MGATVIEWSDRELYRKTALYQWRLFSKRFRNLILAVARPVARPILDPLSRRKQRREAFEFLDKVREKSGETARNSDAEPPDEV